MNVQIIGVGNTGSLIATMLDKEALLFSTATQDTANYKEYNVKVIADEGCGKRFATGYKLWEEKDEVLRQHLKDVVGKKVVITTSLGGGSGSSSITYLVKILKEQKNEVLIVGIVPYKKEQLPPLANAVQSINAMLDLSLDEISVMLFDNEALLKLHKNNWEEVNNSIVRKVSYLLGLLDQYSVSGFSPMTIDQSEFESVVFGGGFIDLSNAFLEDETPKFGFGKLDSETKNVLLAMVADVNLDRKEINKLHTTLTEVTNKIGGKAKNARLVPGILRGQISPKVRRNRAYVTIASGLGIDGYLKYIEKMRDEAITKATKYAERKKTSSVTSRKQNNMLDI